MRDPRASDKILPLSEASFEPDRTKIQGILARGGIPLLSLSDPYSLNSPRIYDIEPDVVEYEPRIRSVAISHVWADGLGNNWNNSLPICQLVKLRDNAFQILSGRDEHIADRIYVWIDTLCVPLHPAEARKSAILTMKDVYQKALTVLVLDAELMRHELPSTALEILVRVISSNWVGRLWTFQEAFYARNLFFQFEDSCTENMSKLVAQLDEDTPENNWWSNLHIKWHPSLHAMEEIRIANQLSQLGLAPSLGNPREIERSLDLFRRIWWALAWRATSKPEDELTCLASILNLDVKAILDTPKKDRMIKFLQLRQVFPSDIIFQQVPRQTQDGYRWAPRSFMNRNLGVGSLDSNEDGVLLERGLLVQFPGFRFPNNKIIFEPDAKEYIIQLSEKNR